MLKRENALCTTPSIKKGIKNIKQGNIVKSM